MPISLAKTRNLLNTKDIVGETIKNCPKNLQEEEQEMTAIVVSTQNMYYESLSDT
jgi:hypothetical protein